MGKRGFGEFETALKPEVPTAATPGGFVLVVVSGPDAGARFVLEAEEAMPQLLGTSAACNVRLRDPHVSRRHASFEVHEGHRLRVRDLTSTNGTFFSSARIVEAFVGAGDALVFGDTVVRIEAGAPASSRDGSPTGRTEFGRVRGSNVIMRRLYPICERLAASDVPVLIEGERGTGKDLLAASLHEQGSRASAPLVILDCTLIRGVDGVNALFGAEGALETAATGTIVLDEVGELEEPLQARIARAMEPGSMRARMIAMTRRDLDREVQAGRFREDLFLRLAVGRIALPPLRERGGDVLTLTRAFWSELGGDARSGPPGDVLARFADYAWPGNVRELQTAVLRQLALGDASLPAGVAPPAAADPMASILAESLPFSVARHKLIDEFEQRYVEHALAAHEGNVSRAAAASGLARRYFQVIRARQRR